MTSGRLPTIKIFNVLNTLMSGKVIFKNKLLGIHLFSHIVSNVVPSAACGLTVVFEMGTGVSRTRIDTEQWRWRDSNS